MKMQDLEIAKDLLKKGNNTLVIVKNGEALFQTRASGIRGFLIAIETIGKEMQRASVADKIVGEAAAHLCAYSEVTEVFAVTLSQCGKQLLEGHRVQFEFQNLVPHILNAEKTDLCPFEKVVAGSRNSEEAYERLRHSVQLSP